MLATVVEDDQKAPFSIATTLTCKGVAPLFSGLVHFILDTYLMLLSVKQAGIKCLFFKSSVWRDLGLNSGIPDHWRTLYQHKIMLMLELCGMWNTPSLPLLPGQLWSGVVASMNQIELWYLKCVQTTDCSLIELLVIHSNTRNSLTVGKRMSYVELNN